jgi:hypothetical protein
MQPLSVCVMVNLVSRILGCDRSVVEVLSPLGCCTLSVGGMLMMMQEILSVTSVRV